MNIFRVYDVVVFEDEDGSIYQDCVKSIRKEMYKCQFEDNVIYSVLTNSYEILVQGNEIIRVCMLDKISDPFHNLKVKFIYSLSDDNEYFYKRITSINV